MQITIFWINIKDRIKVFIGQLLLKANVPGLIGDMVYDDIVTGDYIEVYCSPLAVLIKVNNRDYYFDRFTGKFDGTGCSVYGKMKV